MLRLTMMICVIFSVAACNLPRGAARQNEIVAEAQKPDADLALYHVTRANLPQYKSWPNPNPAQTTSWISHRSHGDGSAIRSGDLLDIVIWDSEEVSVFSGSRSRVTDMKGVKVTTGGTVFLPFVGSVQVAGLSEINARTRIQRKLSEVAPGAQVQLRVTKGAAGSVSIVSGVQRPGPYPVADGHFTALNAIAAAGGASANVVNPQVRLIRHGKVYMKPLSKLLETPSYDTVLKGGDKLSIEDDSRYFRSLGAAAKEAVIPFDKEKISALDAMSMIGGLSDNRADPKGIMILREYRDSQVKEDGTGPSNQRTVYVFDLTSADGLFSAGEFPIFSKDTVFVTESTIASANVALQVFARLTGAAVDLNNVIE